MEIHFIGLDDVITDFTKLAFKNPSAISRSMNRANIAGRTASVKALRKVWVGLKAKDLKRYTWSQKATVSKLNTKFVVTSHPISLADFGAKQNKKGVSYRLKSKRRTMKHAFLKKSKHSRTPMVMIRSTKQRYPLVTKFTITPTSMFIGLDGVQLYEQAYFKAFEKRYDHEVRQIFKK